MTRRKQTCRILKEIRRQIAEANDIEFITSECRYKGDCPGTCPKCEAEVRYLERQLHARSLAGKAVALAGISAGMILLTGCGGTPSRQSEKSMQSQPVTHTEQTEPQASLDEEAEVPADDEDIQRVPPPIPYMVMGEIVDDSDSAETEEEKPLDSVKPDEKDVADTTAVDSNPPTPEGKE